MAVVTNIGAGDHLGMNFINTVEELAKIKRVIVQNVAPTGFGVLNAADPQVVAMASSCPGQVIYFASDRHHPVMATHRAQGKRVVFVDDDCIVAAEGVWRESMPLRDIPLTRGGQISFQIENAMAAIAAAWGAGLIRTELDSYLVAFLVAGVACVVAALGVLWIKGAGASRLGAQPAAA